MMIPSTFRQSLMQLIFMTFHILPELGVLHYAQSIFTSLQNFLDESFSHEMQILSISCASNDKLCEFFQKVFSLLSTRKSDLKNENLQC